MFGMVSPPTSSCRLRLNSRIWSSIPREGLWIWFASAAIELARVEAISGSLNDRCGAQAAPMSSGMVGVGDCCRPSVPTLSNCIMDRPSPASVWRDWFMSYLASVSAAGGSSRESMHTEGMRGKPDVLACDGASRPCSMRSGPLACEGPCCCKIRWLRLECDVVKRPFCTAGPRAKVPSSCSCLALLCISHGAPGSNWHCSSHFARMAWSGGATVGAGCSGARDPLR